MKDKNKRRFFIMEVQPNGDKIKVACGKAGTIRAYSLRLARDHAQNHYLKTGKPTTILEDLESNNLY